MEKVSEFLSQKEAGIISVNEKESCYAIANYDPHTGEPLPDTVLPLPSKDEILSHIAELQNTLDKTNADAKRIQEEIQKAQELL